MKTDINLKLVNKNFEIQIDNKNPKWYDEYGKLLIEKIDAFLQDNNFVEVNYGVWKDTIDNYKYSLNNNEIQSLKNTGIGIMYKI